MKKLLVLFVMTLLLCKESIAQDKLYLVFEFMKVDNLQESDYWETEGFWEKIHQQRVNNGEITGWDFWSLQPGGEEQGYQYLTVTLYNDPEAMMKGTTLEALLNNAKKAYPEMSEDQISTKLNNSSKTRDLAVRLYLEEISATTDDFDMKVGTLAQIDLMKAKQGQSWAYEKAEKEIFKPLHQKMVDAGYKGNWGLLQIMFPFGSDTYASHLTVNMFNDYNQYFKSFDYDGGEPSDSESKAIDDGLMTRDQKWTYMATLEKKVR